MQTIPNILGVFFRMIWIGSKNNSALNFLHEKSGEHSWGKFGKYKCIIVKNIDLNQLFDFIAMPVLYN